MLGQVSGVEGCCFQFDLVNRRGHASAVAAGIFHTHMRVVTLICTEQEIHRYACQSHPALVSDPPAQSRSSRVFGRPTRVIAERPQASGQEA